MLQYTNLIKPLNLFSHQMMMNLDMLHASMKDEVLLYRYTTLSYMIMGFICGIPMLPKSDGIHITCFVTCEATVYSISIDDITIKVCFLLL